MKSTKKNVFNKYWWNHQITCSKLSYFFVTVHKLIYDCRVRLYMQSFTKVYLKVSTSLQSESTYKKKNKPLKKSHTHKTQINLSKIEKKVIKQDFTLINHLYTQIESNHLASDPRVIRLFRKDFISNKHLNMRGTHHFIQIIVNMKVFFDQSNF